MAFGNVIGMKEVCVLIRGLVRGQAEEENQPEDRQQQTEAVLDPIQRWALQSLPCLEGDKRRRWMSRTHA